MAFGLNTYHGYNRARSIMLLIGLVVFAWKFWPIAHEPVSAERAHSASEFVVSAGEFETTYALGRRIDEDLLVVAVNPQRSRKNPLSDFHSQFVSFTPKATKKYINTYPNSKICPAPFLNRNANHIDLYASTPAIAKTLSKWRRPKGSDVSKWETAHITGYCVKKRTKIMRAGEDVTDSLRLSIIGRKGSGDCLSIYVESIAVSPANILGAPKKAQSQAAKDVILFQPFTIFHLICLLWGLAFGATHVFFPKFFGKEAFFYKVGDDFEAWFAKNNPKGILLGPVMAALIWPQNGVKITSEAIPLYFWERLFITIAAIILGIILARMYKEKAEYV